MTIQHIQDITYKNFEISIEHFSASFCYNLRYQNEDTTEYLASKFGFASKQSCIKAGKAMVDKIMAGKNTITENQTFRDKIIELIIYNYDNEKTDFESYDEILENHIFLTIQAIMKDLNIVEKDLHECA